jgi:hypothetical protein
MQVGGNYILCTLHYLQANDAQPTSFVMINFNYICENVVVFNMYRYQCVSDYIMAS